MRQKSSILRNSILAIISMLILVVMFYHWWDISIERWFLAQPHSAIYTFSSLLGLVFASGNWLFTAVICLMIGLLLFFIGKKHAARPWLFFAMAYILTFVLRTVFKFILARYRPELYFSHGLYGFHFFSLKHDWTSMPSGHAASAFGGFLALAAIIHKRWVTYLFLLLATIVALSRLVIVVHYPSDIIFGAYLGILAVYWTHSLYPIRKKR